MKRLFGELNMTWIKVLLFAVIAGVYTGAVMLVPFLENTSFQDIGIAFEWWVVFAVIIVVNCKRPVEAMLKCFVFFLISQPLVYLVEIVFGSLSIGDALGYYRYWFVLTILTLPGGYIAYFCKKENIGGSIVLALGSSIQLMMAGSYIADAIKDFPHHILSAIFCVASVFVMCICIQKQNKYRILSIVLAVAIYGAIVVAATAAGRVVF